MASAKLKTAFEVDGTKLAATAPSARAKSEAKLYSLRKFNEAVRAGVMVEKELERVARERQLWTEEDAKERDRLVASILDGERSIKGGNVNQARAVAIRMSKDRAALQDLTGSLAALKSRTAEALAEQDYFNHLVASATVYDDGPREGRPFYTRDGVAPSVDDFVERATEPAAHRAAAALNETLYGTAAEVLRDLPENQFLRRWKFIDDDFHFIDRAGNRVDEAGNRVDDEGYRLDAEGRRVDPEGRLLDADGDYIVEFEPFTDDDGNVLQPPAPSELKLVGADG